MIDYCTLVIGICLLNIGYFLLIIAYFCSLNSLGVIRVCFLKNLEK